MNQRSVAEFVTQVAGRVTSRVPRAGGDLLSQFGARGHDGPDDDTLETFVARLERFFEPVEPRPELIERLRANLWTAIQNVESEVARGDVPDTVGSDGGRRRLVGFAAIGSASATLLVVLYWLVVRPRAAAPRLAA